MFVNEQTVNVNYQIINPRATARNIMQKEFCLLTKKLKVTGMTFSNCTSAVTKALKTVKGVEDVIVSFSNRAAFVRCD